MSQSRTLLGQTHPFVLFMARIVEPLQLEFGTLRALCLVRRAWSWGKMTIMSLGLVLMFFFFFARSIGIMHREGWDSAHLCRTCKQIVCHDGLQCVPA